VTSRYAVATGTSGVGGNRDCARGSRARRTCTVSVTIREEGIDAPDALIDLAVVRQAHEVLETLRRELGLAQPVDLATVAAFLAGPGARPVRRDEMTWDGVRPAVDQALQKCRPPGPAREPLSRPICASDSIACASWRQRSRRPPPPATRAARKLEERLAAVVTSGTVLDPARLAQEWPF